MPNSTCPCCQRNGESIFFVLLYAEALQVHGPENEGCLGFASRVRFPEVPQRQTNVLPHAVALEVPGRTGSENRCNLRFCCESRSRIPTAMEQASANLPCIKCESARWHIACTGSKSLQSWRQIGHLATALNRRIWRTQLSCSPPATARAASEWTPKLAAPARAPRSLARRGPQARRDRT